MKSLFLILCCAAIIGSATVAMADTVGSATGGTAATQSGLSGCLQQAPSLSSGQQVGLSCDASGNLYVNVNGGGVSVPATTQAQTAALASNLVVKATPGSLFDFEVSADATLSGAAWWVLVFDASSAPGDGAVTPNKCYAMPAQATSIAAAFPAPATFLTGITIVVSTTGCFTKTASAHAFIAAGFK